MASGRAASAGRMVPSEQAVASGRAATSAGIDQRRFRQVLGYFCTGVTVVTSMAGSRPVGFACQSFSSLSLDPPLVLFCPSLASRTWPAIRCTGAFCVNVLAEEQRELSARFGRSGAQDRFAGLDWSLSPGGAPVLGGALTWVDCVVEAEHAAGDHLVVIGRVTELGPAGERRPLLFYRGDYTVAEVPEDSGPPHAREVLDTLLAWSRHTDWM
jgi:3-hydroxy-9,10-secoandrosta-1,3,5(10)-triene-9,17-dione monooxygenase reductase component